MSDRHGDLDALLASAATGIRPTAAFEEDLLLRIDDELSSADGLVADVEPIPLREPRPAGRPQSRSLLARAAAVLLLIGLGVSVALSVSDDPETIQTGLPEPASAVLADACTTHLPAIQPYAIEGALSGAETDWQTTIVPDLVGASDGFVAALRTSRDLLSTERVAPALLDRTDELIATAGEIGDFLSDEVQLWDAGFRDQARTSMPLVANRLTGLAAEIASLGVTACQPSP